MGELGGMHKGLTDEVHAQLKRVDAGDTRIWDFRRQVEEQCRVLCAEAQEKNRIAVSTKSRELGDQHEDTSRKINLQLRRLEAAMEDRAREHDVRLTALRSKVESQEKNYREGAAENFYKAFRQLKDHDNTLTSHGTRIEELEACWSNLVEEGYRPTVGAVDPPQSPSDNHMTAYEEQRRRAQQKATEEAAQQRSKDRDVLGGRDFSAQLAFNSPSLNSPGGQDIYNHATSKALLDAYSRFSTTENTPVRVNSPNHVDAYDRTTF